MSSILRDPGLSPEGLKKIQWARAHMPVVNLIEEAFIREQPFKGLRLTMSIHLEAKTARTALLFKAGGAEVHATGCNPLSTQDDVAAGLASQGVNVYAWHGATDAEYREHLLAALACKPHLILDDGGDLTQILTDERPDLAVNLFGGGEETTTGVMRLRARAAAGKLPFPMLTVNDADMKCLFDNRYGTGQSVWDGIMRTTNLIVAGKLVVVAGYGWCGKGVAMRAKGMGARVAVCEVNPVRAVEAAMDGFEVLTMKKAAPLGDLFVTVTGCKDVIPYETMLLMKDGAVLCNAGHFNVEVDVAALESKAQSAFEARHNIMGYALENGKTVYVLAEGRLVNLAAGDGHPAEIMDTSFALQSLCAAYLAKNHDHLAPGVHLVPKEIDTRVAELKLQTLGLDIDALTPEQERYILSENG